MKLNADTVVLKRTPVRLFWALVLAMTGACSFNADLSYVQKRKIEEAYRAYRHAIQERNLEALRGMVAREKAKELEGEEAGKMLELASTLYPPDPEMKKIEIKGRAATLELSAENDQMTMQGTVQFVLAADVSYIGRTSLGAFRHEAGVLKVCGGEPGATKRPQSFASTVGIRCFELIRIQEARP